MMDWFRDSMGVYTLKELEKLLPAIGGCHAMHVKEHIQTLCDEGAVRVEKIGSGNWYWSFVRDAQRSKEMRIQGLRAEEEKLRSGIAEVEKRLAAAEEEEEARRAAEDGTDADKDNLLAEVTRITTEVAALEHQLAGLEGDDPVVVQQRQEQSKKWKELAHRWTDHLESLESVLVHLTNGDRMAVGILLSRACGEEYVVGDGLVELVA